MFVAAYAIGVNKVDPKTPVIIETSTDSLDNPIDQEFDKTLMTFLHPYTDYPSSDLGNYPRGKLTIVRLGIPGQKSGYGPPDDVTFQRLKETIDAALKEVKKKNIPINSVEMGVFPIQNDQQTFTNPERGGWFSGTLNPLYAAIAPRFLSIKIAEGYEIHVFYNNPQEYSKLKTPLLTFKRNVYEILFALNYAAQLVIDAVNEFNNDIPAEQKIKINNNPANSKMKYSPGDDEWPKHIMDLMVLRIEQLKMTDADKSKIFSIIQNYCKKSINSVVLEVQEQADEFQRPKTEDINTVNNKITTLFESFWGFPRMDQSKPMIFTSMHELIYQLLGDYAEHLPFLLTGFTENPTERDKKAINDKLREQNLSVSKNVNELLYKLQASIVQAKKDDTQYPSNGTLITKLIDLLIENIQRPNDGTKFTVTKPENLKLLPVNPVDDKPITEDIDDDREVAVLLVS